MDFPVVINPVDGRKSSGVISEILDEITLKKWLYYVRQELGHWNIIVENHVFGEDHRVFVVGDKVVAALKRVPANVIGDGKHTIRQLIDKKNILRKNNPNLSKNLIKIDKDTIYHLDILNYHLENVPDLNEVIYLRSISSISSGGDAIDITRSISEEEKSIAVKAIKAIPGLNHGGVDIIYDNNKKTNNLHIIEINSGAAISIHVFPAIGESIDVPSALLDYYFPESIENKHLHKNLFYDFKYLISPLIKGEVKKAILTPLTEVLGINERAGHYLLK